MLASLPLAIGLVLALCAAAPDASARPRDNGPPCTREDQRLATTGRGDADHDGLSDCREKRILGTSARDDDSDDDGLEDGAEVLMGTNPLDADSDDDTLADGTEDELGTDPTDVDTDDDGVRDCDDPDPADELASRIASDVQALVCPTAGADGSIVLLGIEIALTAETRFEDVASCDELAGLIATAGSAHVEVKVEEAGAALVGLEVEVDDGDHDGRPDHGGRDHHGDDQGEDD